MDSIKNNPASKFLFDPHFVQDTLKNNTGSSTITEQVIKQQISQEVSKQFFNLAVVIIDIAAFAAVCYMVYYIIHYMFFNKSEHNQKMLFGFFWLLLLRIFSTVIRAKFL